MGPNDGAGASPTPSEPSLLNDLQGMESGLDGGSSNPLLEESGAGMAGGGQGNLFKFAGREYQNQQEAEKHWSKLYGQYSEQKGVVNTVKEALKDPELLEALAEDPKWASIFAKLGIETDTQNVQDDRSEQGQEQGNQEMHEWRVEREVDKLEREEYRFERELGRAMSPEERVATLKIISRAQSLSWKEAWQLANHEKLLKEASGRAATPQLGQNKGKVQRPPPLPSSVQGSPVNSKKPVHKMSASEWKENLRNDPDIRELLSR